MIRSDRLFIIGLVISDIAATCVSFSLAHWIRFTSGWFAAPLGYPTFDQQMASLVVLSAIWLLAFKWCGLYEPRRRITGIDEFYSVLLGTLLAAGIFVCVAFLTKATWYSRSVLLIGLLLNLILVTAARGGLRAVRAAMWRKGHGIRGVIVVGTDAEAQTMAQVVGKPQVGSRFVGFVAGRTDVGVGDGVESEDRIRLLGTVQDLPRLVKAHDVQDVVVTCGSLEERELLDLVSVCSALGLQLKLTPDILDIMKRRGEVEDYDGLALINVSEIPWHGWSRIAKRSVDIAVSVVGLVFFAPLMLLVALVIKLTSAGTVFFVQERASEGGRTFRMYKFRTMRQNAYLESVPVWGMENDPRRTPIGRILRRLSLDELPQLLNVLRGEMSLVGPRPEEPYFMEQFSDAIPCYMERHKMKAGLTGWAQVHGLRGNTPVEERTQYDIYYVRNWSLLLDFKILVKTVFEVLFHKHAR